MSLNPHRGNALRWQSGLLLAVVTLPVAVSVLVQSIGHSSTGPTLIVTGIGIGAVFGLLVWSLRAATPAAALTGAVFTIAFYYAGPGWRSLLWPLLALFALTFAATRFGRRRKEELQLAEGRKGRSASQVAANLGAAALATIPIGAHSFGLQRYAVSPMLIALVAALAEATADTLSSELGEVLGGEPVLLTTLRRVPAGTDGAISFAGTLAGCAGAAVIALIAFFVLPLSWEGALIALAAGTFGLFIDSVLGATLERRGWLNNDAVNFLSTLAAAVFAVLVSGWR